MDSVDPHNSLLAKDAEPINDAWYINAYIPRTSWPKEVISRGFDLTPSEYLAATSFLTTLLLPNSLYNLQFQSPQERTIKLWPVIEKFEAECGFWGKQEASYGVKIPGWWKRQCLDGWIVEVSQYMRDNRLPQLPPHPTPYRLMSFPRREGGPRLSPMSVCGEGCELGKCLHHGVKIAQLEMLPGLWREVKEH